jgi:apolipoprotein N-acyltransferase
MRRTARLFTGLVPLIGGVLIALSLPPFGLWPLAIAGVALLAGAVRQRCLAGRALAGLLAGIGQLVIGLAWADKFTLVGYLALVLVQSAMFALACALAPNGRARVPALAGLLTLAEWARDSWPFGGVPPGGIALGQVGGPLLGTARIGGSVLLAGLTYLAGVGLGDLAVGLWHQRAGTERQGRGVVAGCLSILVVVVFAVWGAFGPDGGPPLRTVRVALVQGGGRRGLSDLEVPASVVYAAAHRATMQVRPPVDLVLWPEDTVALDQPLTFSPEAAQLSRLARSLHTTLVAGVTETVGSSQFRNEVVAYSPSGVLVAVFEKVHRVPFGEYVPWRAFFSHFANLQAVPRDAIAGHGSGMIATPAGPLAVLVSYEVFFPDRGRSGVRAGGQLIIVPTNTSSYSSDQAPAQEVAASRLQAVEEGRDLVQVAPTGYSAIIDNRGRVLAQTPLSVSAVLRATVPLRVGKTLYNLAGNAPSLLLALLSVLVGLALGGLEHRRRVRDGSPS